MPRRNFYRAVIFNFEGVLLETERATCDAWKRAGAGSGYPMTEPVVRTLIGMPKSESGAFLQKVFGESFPFEAIHQRMIFFRDAYFEHWGLCLKRGTTALMEVLDKFDVRKAIVSESSQKLVDKWTLHSGLFVHFPVVISADENPAARNPITRYLLAAERLNTPAEQCLVVEHSDCGVRSAHAAGMTVILVPGLQQPSAQAMLHAYHVEQTLENLADDLLPMLVPPFDDDSQRRTIITTTFQTH